MEKRPVWIFSGVSGAGKSTIATMIRESGLEVYETDSCDELPEVITASVVVLGNRNRFLIGDLKDRLFGDPKVILVNFREN